MKKKIIALILTLTMLLGATACSSVTNEISYSLDETEKFHDISFKYDSRWEKPEDNDSDRAYFLISDKPFAQICYNYVYYDKKSLDVMSDSDIMDIYTKIDDDETLIDKSQITLENNVKAQKVQKNFVNNEGKERFLSKVVFFYNDCIYELIGLIDYPCKDSCEKIISDICDSITFVNQSVTTKDDIDGYEYGNFDTYNSYAEDNGLAGTKIYINGTVKSVYNYSDFMCFSIISEDNGKWLSFFSNEGDIAKAEKLFGENEVTLFGEYLGYSDVFQMPSVQLDYILYDGEKYQMSYFSNNNVSNESDTSLDSTDKEQTIINANDVSVVYKGIEKTKYGSKVKLYIENNSIYDYDFQLRNVSINNFMYEPVMSVEVNSGKKANDGFTIETDFLEENDITDINSISLSIHAINWKSYSNSFDTETVTFNP